MSMKITISKLLFGLLATGLTSQVQAQVRFSTAPQVGVNFASAKYNGRVAIYNYSTTALTGIEAGGLIMANYRHLQVQTGLLYDQMRFNLNLSYQQYSDNTGGFMDYNEHYALRYLTVPLTFAYTQRTDGQGMHLVAGAYVSRLIGGHATYNDLQGVVGKNSYRYEGEQDIKAGISTQNPDYYYSRGFDVGLQGGIGYQYGSFLLQVLYKRGLNDLGADYPLNPPPFDKRNSCYTRGVNISMSYQIQLSN